MRKFRKELRELRARIIDLPLETREQYAAWYKRQARWHKRVRRNNPQWCWHKEQQDFYERAATSCFKFSEIVIVSIRRNLAKILANVAKNNALFQRLKSGSKSR